MAFSLSPVKTEDVGVLVRRVEFPAHLGSPLRRFMFPRSTEQQWDCNEDEIKWAIDGIHEAIHRENETLYKACGADGLPVGLIGWTTCSGVFSNGMINGQNFIQDDSIINSEERQSRKMGHHDSWTPPSLDVPSWLGISKLLRAERQRVFQRWHGNEICRITFMAVDPDHQRKGVGSTLLKMLCDIVDKNELHTFVLSSPDGVQLYSKFAFKPVGVVETKQGNFTSMLRNPVLDARKNMEFSL